MSSATVGNIDYAAPTTLEDVHELLAESSSAKLVAGGQSLMLLLRQGFVDADLLVDISGVPSLAGIEITDNRIRLNAAITYSEIADHGLSERYAELGDAVDVIADQQVRNMGTVGGALSHADPSLDIVPPLLCLNADVTISSVDGSRTLRLGEFLTGYMETDLADHEVLTSISFDRRDHGLSGGSYRKHAKVKGSWPIVGASSVVTLSEDHERFTDVRVSLSAAAYTAVRAPSVEDTLEGQSTTTEAVEAAASGVIDDIDPIDDPSGSIEFKQHLATVLTERAIDDAVERAGGELE